MERRKFYKGIIHHCYQRSAGGGILFYTISDHLVFFTLYCCLARKYGIQVLALCQMPDHVHDSIVSESAQTMARFKRELNSRFAKLYNRHCGTGGPVFESPFGSAPKLGAKKGRTNLIYVYNNPVERQLVEKAEEYRWNYLAYCLTPNPFSAPIVIRRSSKSLKTAVSMVKAQFKAGRPMNHQLLNRMAEKLHPDEIQQLIDFIISTYNVIDYQEAIRYFDNFPDMLTAIHANTGSEYDLNETFLGKSDRLYAKMSRVLMATGRFRDIHEVLALDRDQKQELLLLLRKTTGGMREQIAKYLHLELPEKNSRYP